MNLNGEKMRVIQAALNGVVGRETIFHFSQTGSVVEARYSDGRIVTGYLVGILKEDSLPFRYCPVSDGVQVDGGVSRGRLETLSDGRLRIIESFTWESRTGEGLNVFEETD